MKFFCQYTNIPNFLKRFTVIKIGKLHIRIHTIQSCDVTTLVHNHPFNYISFVLWGGYRELRIKNDIETTVDIKPLRFVFGRHTTFHRIEKLLKNKCITLFIAYGNYGWKARNLSDKYRADGLYQRTINGKVLWCKSTYGIWFIGHDNKFDATVEQRHSIYQA